MFRCIVLVTGILGGALGGQSVGPGLPPGLAFSVRCISRNFSSLGGTPAVPTFFLSAVTWHCLVVAIPLLDRSFSLPGLTSRGHVMGSGGSSTCGLKYEFSLLESAHFSTCAVAAITDDEAGGEAMRTLYRAGIVTDSS